MAPMNTPARSVGFMMLTLNSLRTSRIDAEAASTPLMSAPAVRPTAILISSMYEASRARAVKAAEPMAKPLPVAAVVLPSASSTSVRWRTSGSSSDIWALPPALSAIGPYASVARVMPRVLSMPTAAIATP